jgi:hypothetical protein
VLQLLEHLVRQLAEQAQLVLEPVLQQQEQLLA